MGVKGQDVDLPYKSEEVVLLYVSLEIQASTKSFVSCPEVQLAIQLIAARKQQQ